MSIWRAVGINTGRSRKLRCGRRRDPLRLSPASPPDVAALLGGSVLAVDPLPTPGSAAAAVGAAASSPRPGAAPLLPLGPSPGAAPGSGLPNQSCAKPSAPVGGEVSDSSPSLGVRGGAVAPGSGTQPCARALSSSSSPPSPSTASPSSSSSSPSSWPSGSVSLRMRSSSEACSAASVICA